MQRLGDILKATTPGGRVPAALVQDAVDLHIRARRCLELVRVPVGELPSLVGPRAAESGQGTHRETTGHHLVAGAGCQCPFNVGFNDLNSFS